MAIELGPQIGLEGLLFLVSFTALIVPALTFSRLWILRHRKKTPARLSSDIFTVVFMFTIVANGGLLLSNTVMELLIKRNEAGGQNSLILGTILNVFEKPPSAPGATDYILDERLYDRAEKYLQRSFGSSTVYTIQLWVLKGAFLSLYYDLIPQLSIKVRWGLYLTTAYTAVTLIACLVVQFKYCPQLDQNWNPVNYCTYITSLTWINSVSWINITTDLLIMVIPLFIISTLKLGGRERYALGFIFGLGFMSIVSSVVRFVILHSMAAAEAPSIELIHSAILWGSIECIMAYAAFCLPAFRVLIRRGGEAKKMDTVMSSRHGGTLASRTGHHHGGPGGKKNYIRSEDDKCTCGKGKGYNGIKDVKEMEEGIVVRNSLSVTSGTESETELRPWDGQWERQPGSGVSGR